MDKKSKVGFGNMLTVIGTILIVMGILYSVKVGLDVGGTRSFFSCMIGTGLIFLGGYIRDGYFKFFN